MDKKDLINKNLFEIAVSEKQQFLKSNLQNKNKTHRHKKLIYG